MKIWIINQTITPPKYSPHNRHYNLAKFLNLMGHETTVFVGSYVHNSSIQLIEDNSLIKQCDCTDFPFYYIKTINYGHSKAKRIYAMYQFYKNILKATKKFERPDVIIGSSPHPFSIMTAMNLSKRYKCQFITEIRDLWPESFVDYGILHARNPIVKLLYESEKWLYKKADKIIFTMEGGKDYIKNKKWEKNVDLEKIYHLNNGVDLEFFYTNQAKYHILDDSHLSNKHTFKVIYTGSIRRVNNIRILCDTAKYIQDSLNNKGLQFLIYGEGNEKEKLQNYCTANKIKNIIFKGPVEKKYIPYILSCSNANIIHSKSCDELTKYGISHNKAFEYFAAGKPVISTFKSGYSLIKKHKLGIECETQTPEAIADAIIKIKDMNLDEYEHICKNNRQIAKEYDFKSLAQKLLAIIES